MFLKSAMLTTLISAISFAGIADNHELPIQQDKTVDDRPNIIVLLADDLSYHSVGFSGNTQVITPKLDQLANDGVIFDRAYDTTAICMASRAQVFTGKYEFKTGTNFLHGAMTPAIWKDSYQVRLKQDGYYTGFVGKFGFAVKDDVSNWDYNKPEHLPIDDFDEWYGWPSQGSYNAKANTQIKKFSKAYPHTTAAVAAASMEFIDKAKEREAPFLLSISFKAPHKPFSPDPAYDDIYKDTVWKKPNNYGEQGAKHIPQQAKSGRQYRTMLDFIDSNYQENMRKYNQLVYGIDVAVGMIRDHLTQAGVADNTVILFLSDNGYSLGAHNMSGKVLPYEEPSRTPFIVFDPRQKKQQSIERTRALVSNLDVAPTLFELAGSKPPLAMDGNSVLPLLTDSSARTNEAILLIQDWGNGPTHSLSVVTENFKYIYWPYAHDMPVAEELYDLRNDALEMTNLIDDPEYSAQLRLLQNAYDTAIKKWKSESVKTGDYPVYGDIFDRHLSWQKKLTLMPQHIKESYTQWERIEQAELERKAKRKNKNKKEAKRS